MATANLFDRIEDVRSLAQIVMETVREPLLVLDGNLEVLAASNSFYRAFQVSPEHVLDHKLFALDDGAWDIPALHALLEETLAVQPQVEGFQVAQDFPRIGPRILLLHAREVQGIYSGHELILLGFEDVTERRAIEAEKMLLQARTDELLNPHFSQTRLIS